MIARTSVASEETMGAEEENVNPEIAAFWEETRAQLDRVPVDAEVSQLPERSGREYATYGIRLRSFGDVHVRAWLSTPLQLPPGRRHPAVLVTPGYSMEPTIRAELVLRGYAVLTLPPRGQGESGVEWRLPALTKLTFSLDDPQQFYYRGAYMDCVRGIDYLSAHPDVDPDRIGVWGRSQGGAYTLATAALDRRVRVAVAEEPFLSNFPVGCQLDTPPFNELRDYFRAHPDERERGLATLAYFDVMNLAELVRCPTLVNVGLKDEVCPYETIRPAFDRLPGLKSLMVYPELDHQPCADFHVHGQHWLARYIG
ncbi:MAG: acetylxylan esterase [Chloroflexi bacterium]|nr:acetylxylan esterase [Chloroflexota bacterium]